MNTGIGASSGIGIGKALLVYEPEIVINNDKIYGQEAQAELLKIQDAISKSINQLKEIKKKSELNNNQEAADIIETHISLLNDPVLFESIESNVIEKNMNGPLAVNEAINQQVLIFDAIDDPYIKERAKDIQDIGNRIIHNLLNINPQEIFQLEEAVILVGKDITPAQMALIDKTYVQGIVAEIGGETCHTAILARNMEIPAVLGVKGICDLIQKDVLIAIDGTKGTVEYDLSEETLMEYKEKIQQDEQAKKELSIYKNCVTRTKDGRHVELGGNIGLPQDVNSVFEYGAEGIGLFRTEFLFMDTPHLPSEEVQFDAYRSVVEKMGSKPVIIRTLDIGGDKNIPYLDLPKEENPFLGYRAIRICFDRIDIFKSQLRAILRASAYGNARIMYPMIASVEEVIQANAILSEVKSDLLENDIPFNSKIEVGVMIEIPSAAITADLIIKEVDFFSIGTNDLTQYTLAADRMNDKVRYIYNSFHPSLLRLIKNVIDTSHSHGKFTGMCGEFAGNPLAAIMLLGMGLDEFSMSPSSIPKIRQIINSVSYSDAQKICDEVMELSSPNEIEAHLKERLSEILNSII
ncbi:phosphoenolpyruvate--protein phosphotransferase [Alkaliphilus peptidifermentans]|uniref:Phosphoenolpyruvate-protein phosphotransferase n=1 Tax=Alkaliphilus peptidifermentans DSM 18978 TaxID=1120976 RepID=A0A1G5FVM0_9FIRM|nr:phosphoenolpyruvate--protein phosphotransferase [Alkaliphilus peptidifermentans]SCY43345.1 phosphoenolpyruvate--protein phosphotransferase [Alkaliphilus peptidifermentans DSM 18978]